MIKNADGGDVLHIKCSRPTSPCYIVCEGSKRARIAQGATRYWVAELVDILGRSLLQSGVHQDDAEKANRRDYVCDALPRSQKSPQSGNDQKR